jgi:predicted nuclease with RNAse H fold
MRTLGIDLAAQNPRTAACLIEWSPDNALVATPVVGKKGTELDWLVDLADGVEAVGIDAPFGFPDAVVKALPEWASGGTWTDAPKEELRYRITDRFVRDHTRRSPLSASSDLIAVAAWRCAALLDRLRGPGQAALSRFGEDGVYEVYPGAALTCWGFDRAGYKTSGNAAAKAQQRLVRERLLAAFRSNAPWLELGAAADVCVDSDDALDAMIASLVARAAATGRTIEPAPEHDRTVIAREGWIHLPATAESFTCLIQPTS